MAHWFTSAPSTTRLTALIRIQFCSTATVWPTLLMGPHSNFDTCKALTCASCALRSASMYYYKPFLSWNTHTHRHTKSLAAYLFSLKLQSSAMKALQSFVSNPNPNLCRTSSPSYQIYSPTIVRFDRFLRSSQPSVRRRGLALALDLGRRPNLSLSRSFISHAASHEESVSRIQSSRLSILFHFFILVSGLV